MPHETPAKPRPDFPLFPSGNGSWAKKVKKKLYYFGSWTTDPKGEAALINWLERKDGILAGLDSLRVKGQVAGLTLSQLRDAFLEAKKLQVAAAELSPQTLRDYTYELENLLKVFPADGQVLGLSPSHFSKYAKHLVEGRKLGRHARRRVTAYVKAIFRWGTENGKIPTMNFGTDFTAPDTSPDAMRQAKARTGQRDFSKRLVSGEEIDLLLSKATPNFKAMILLGINCGLGPADLGRLKWEHLDLSQRLLTMPRGKTGTERRSYLWKKTVAALERVAKLKHTQKSLKAEGSTALVFLTRKGLAFYREFEKGGRVHIANAISGTFGRLASNMPGVTFYRLRHTFKTLGKRARDKDALNLAMGHKEKTTGEVYDHEDISVGRLKRLAKKVYRGLWPSVKAKPMRLAA